MYSIVPLSKKRNIQLHEQINNETNPFLEYEEFDEMGLIKQMATSYLVHSRLPFTVWYWAVKQAVCMYRARACTDLSV